MTSTLTRRALGLLPLALLSGCNMVVMNASGDIARQQGQLVVVSTLLMLLWSLAPDAAAWPTVVSCFSSCRAGAICG